MTLAGHRDLAYLARLRLGTDHLGDAAHAVTGKDALDGGSPDGGDHDERVALRKARDDLRHAVEGRGSVVRPGRCGKGLFQLVGDRLRNAGRGESLEAVSSRRAAARSQVASSGNPRRSKTSTQASQNTARESTMVPS